MAIFNKKNLHSYFNIVKDNLPIITIILTLIGSIGQFINLLYLSPSLLIFFSPSQAIIEGILFLIVFLVACINLFLIILMYTNVNKYFKNKGLKLITIIISLLLFFFIDFHYSYLLFQGVFIQSYIFLLVIIRKILLEENKIEENKIEENKIEENNFYFNISYFILFIVIHFCIFITTLPTYSDKSLNDNKIINLPNCIMHQKLEFKIVFVNDKYAIYGSNKKDIFIVKDLNNVLDKLILDLQY